MFIPSNPNSKNTLQQVVHKTVTQSQSPVDEAHVISYGVISDVNNETSQVKVRLFSKNSDLEPTDILGGAFLPLMNPLSQIHHLWGALRKGLIVRVHSRGKLDQKNAIIEVIGDENSSFLTKKPEVNEITIGPYRIFSGGIF